MTFRKEYLSLIRVQTSLLVLIALSFGRLALAQDGCRACSNPSVQLGVQNTVMSSFNAIAGEIFTRQVGGYGICNGMVFQDIKGTIDWGDGTSSDADYRDYLHADNAKMYGSHTYTTARPQPYRLCGRYTQATCNNNGHLYPVGDVYECMKSSGQVYVYLSTPLKSVTFPDGTVIKPGQPAPGGLITLVSKVSGDTGAMVRITSDNAAIAYPNSPEIVINPGVGTGTFSVSKGSLTGKVTFTVTSGAKNTVTSALTIQ